MIDKLDEAWHAMFHLLDAFDPDPAVQKALKPEDRVAYQQRSVEEAKRVMNLLYPKETAL